MPKTLFIAGTRRNAGKTLVSELLLRSLPEMGAIKITCCHGACPREVPCGVCGALKQPFALVQDSTIINTPGKDTARLQAATRGSVVWLQSKPKALAEGLAAALEVFQDVPVVLVEGNAAFQAARPDLGVLVIGPGPEPAKASVKVALDFVAAVVLNTRPHFPPPEMLAGLPQNIRTFTFDAAHPDDHPEAKAFIEWIAVRLGLKKSAH
jgi:molybdopterin-guanine dinucleotide biosynthesis protein